jgi:FkbM family methyltransferase
MLMIEKNINRLAGTFGVEINRTRSCLTLRTLLRDFFRRFEVDCVFDVGANTGGYAQFLRNDLDYKGLIISFEPVTSTFRQLRESATGDARWTTRQMALGSENNLLKIHITKDSSFSSFLTPDHQTIDNFRGQNEVQAEEEVPVRRLDSLFEELRSQHGFRRPYLKMDTQGFDREVLQGAKGVLPEFVGLQSELSLLAIYEGMPGLADMHSAIAQAGFDLVGMYPINRDRAGRLIEADSVYVRRKLAESFSP